MAIKKKAQKKQKDVRTKEDYRKELLEYMSNMSNPFPQRQEFAGILGVVRMTIYNNFTTDELAEIEKEAYELRLKNNYYGVVAVLEAMRDKAIQGNTGAAKLYLEYTIGKPVEHQEITFPGIEDALRDL